MYFEGLQKSWRLASISTVILEMNLNESHLLFVSIPTPQVGAMFNIQNWEVGICNNCTILLRCDGDRRAARSVYTVTVALAV